MKNILLIAYTFIVTFLSAQEFDLTTDEFRQIEDLININIEKHDTFISQLDNKQSQNLNLLDTVIIHSNSYSHHEHAQYLRNNIGLSLRGSHLENLNNSDISEEGYFFKRSDQLGLHWNILNNGYLENRKKAKAIELNGIIKENSTSRFKNQSLAKHITTQVFNQNKIQLLNSRVKLLDDIISIYSITYAKKQTSWNDLTFYIGEKAIVENMLLNYQEYNVDSSLTYNPLPVFQIDYSKLSQLNDKLSLLDDSLLSIKKQALKEEYALVNELSVNLYSRYNRYTQANGNNRNFTSAGITVSIPLPLRINTSKNVVEAEYLEFKSHRENINQNTINEISDLCYEFEYAFNDYIKFYIKKLKLREEIRIEKAKRDIKDVGYSSMHLLKLFNVLYDINHELEDINKRLYLYLIDINKHLPNNTIKDFTLAVDFEDLFKKPTEKKSMYLWSKDFQKNSNKNILETLINGDFNELIISTNNDSKTADKFKSLSTELKKNNITCQLLIGKNSWLGDLNKQSKFISSIPKNIFDGIHLDIEPHAIEGWKTGKKDSLTQDYLAILKNINSQSTLPISVSIPTYYDESFLAQIKEYTSSIYIMAYENTDINFITRKTKEERALFSEENISIAISMKDFQTAKGINTHITNINNALKIKNIAIHDYDTYLMLINQ